MEHCGRPHCIDCLGLGNVRLSVHGRVVFGISLLFLLFDAGEPDAAALALPLPLEVVSDGPGDYFKPIVNSPKKS